MKLAREFLMAGHSVIRKIVHAVYLSFRGLVFVVVYRGSAWNVICVIRLYQRVVSLKFR